MYYNVWDGITYPFLNFNGADVECWELISNCIPHVTGHANIYPSYCKRSTGVSNLKVLYIDSFSDLHLPTMLIDI